MRITQLAAIAALVSLTGLLAAPVARAQCGSPHVADTIHFHVLQSLSQIEPNYCGPRFAQVSIFNPNGNPPAAVDFFYSTQTGGSDTGTTCQEFNRTFAPACSNTGHTFDLAPGESRSYFVDVMRFPSVDWEVQINYTLAAAATRGVQVEVAYFNDCTRIDGSVPPNFQPTLSDTRTIVRDGCR